MLEVELYNVGQPSRPVLVSCWSGPVRILGVTVLWWFGYASVWVPLGMAVSLASLSAFGRLHRIPWLRGEIAKLDELARTLA